MPPAPDDRWMIKAWLGEFLAAHQARHPRDDWPYPDRSEGRRLWGQWFDAFKAARISRPEAEAASRAIHGHAIECRDDHLGVLLRAVEQARTTPASLPAADRADAEAKSRDCSYCGGSGMPAVYHPLYRGEVTIRVETANGTIPIAGRVVAHCVCPLGRWLRQHVEPELLKRIPDYLDCLEDRSRWLPDDPTMPPIEDCEPRHWRDLVKRLGERSRIANTDIGVFL